MNTWLADLNAASQNSQSLLWLPSRADLQGQIIGIPREPIQLADCKDLGRLVSLVSPELLCEACGYIGRVRVFLPDLLPMHTSFKDLAQTISNASFSSLILPIVRQQQAGSASTQRFSIEAQHFLSLQLASTLVVQGGELLQVLAVHTSQALFAELQLQSLYLPSLGLQERMHTTTSCHQTHSGRWRLGIEQL